MIQMVLDALTLRCTLEYGRAWASCTRVSTVGTCGRPHLSYVRDGAARPVRLSRATWHIARGHARGHARARADAMLARQAARPPAARIRALGARRKLRENARLFFVCYAGVVVRVSTYSYTV